MSALPVTTFQSTQTQLSQTNISRGFGITSAAASTTSLPKEKARKQLFSCFTKDLQDERQQLRCIRILWMIIFYIAAVIRCMFLGSNPLMSSSFSIVLSLGPLVSLIELFIVSKQQQQQQFSQPRTTVAFLQVSSESLFRMISAFAYAIPYLALLFFQEIPMSELYFVLLVIWNVQVILSESGLQCWGMSLSGSILFLVADYAQSSQYIELVIGSGILSVIVSYQKIQLLREQQGITAGSSLRESQTKSEKKSARFLVEVHSRTRNSVNIMTQQQHQVILSGSDEEKKKIIINWKVVEGQSNLELFEGQELIDLMNQSFTQSKKKKSISLFRFVDDFIQNTFSNNFSTNSFNHNRNKKNHSAHCKVLINGASSSNNSTLPIARGVAAVSVGIVEGQNRADSMNGTPHVEVSFEFQDEEKQFYKNYLKFQKHLMEQSIEKALKAIESITQFVTTTTESNIELSGSISLQSQSHGSVAHTFRRIKHASYLAEFTLRSSLDFICGKYSTRATSFNFKQALKDMVSEYSSAWNEHAINLILINNARDVKQITNDRQRILQVLRILIDNSIAAISASTNYSDNSFKKEITGGHVILKVNKSRDPRYLRIEVDDSGSGIQADDDAFKPPFPRPKTLEQSQHNLTQPIRLGLYNLNKIIQKIGPEQELVLKSTKGVGTKMSFKIFRSLLTENRDKSLSSNSSPSTRSRAASASVGQYVDQKRRSSEATLSKSPIASSSTKKGQSEQAGRRDSTKRLSLNRKPKYSMNLYSESEIEEESQNQLSDDPKSNRDLPAENYGWSRKSKTNQQSQKSQQLQFRLSEPTYESMQHSSTATLLKNATGGGGNNATSISCMDDSLKSEGGIGAAVFATNPPKKKLGFQMLAQQQSKSFQLQQSQQLSLQSQILLMQTSPSSMSESPSRSKGRLKSVTINEINCGPILFSDTNSPKVSSTDASPKQKSILKRSKHTQQVSQQQQMNQQQNQQVGFGIEAVAVPAVPVDANEDFQGDLEDEDVDEDNVEMQQIEEYQDCSEKSPQFMARKSHMEKKLSHMSDFSRMLVPQNMPSTTVFSNSRLGNDISPKNNLARHTARNSTFNFTEIFKDF